MHSPSLLDGFRATQLFITPYARSAPLGGLADLASWMEFVDHGRGPPIDAAMWSDWLDAVLTVKPSWTDVRDVRAQIQHEYEQFVDLREAGASKATMDELRARHAGCTWHRVGNFQCTPIEAYEFMRVFLQAFWKRGLEGSKDVAALLQTMTAEASTHAHWQTWVALLAAAQSAAASQSSS